MSLFDIFDAVKVAFGFLTGRSRIASKADTACLVVGMERSRKYGQCPGSRHDANAMYAILRKHGSTTMFLDSQATVANVSVALDRIVGSKLAIFYYSGHGGKSGGSEHLCLDNGPLWDHQIWDRISKSGGRVVCIFDCCHSGHMFRDSDGSKNAVEPTKYTGFRFSFLSSLRTPRSSEELSRGEHNVLVWAGCPKDAYSYGDSSGGILTNGIVAAYRPCRTYSDVWKLANRAASSQEPVRTILGTGFSGPVFR